MGPGNQLGKPIPIAEVSMYTPYRAMGWTPHDAHCLNWTTFSVQPRDLLVINIKHVYGDGEQKLVVHWSLSPVDSAVLHALLLYHSTMLIVLYAYTYVLL